MRFPDGFMWGTATAAYQIEGSAGADGRGVSIWDTFSHRPGTTTNGDTGDVACDHYRRLEGDLDLLADLGAPAYRFSVSWARVQPTGKGPANQPGLDFYRRLIDGLRARGVRPVLTLYHWDMPQALEDAGGWVERDTVSRFAEYAAVVGEALGDGVEMLITLNEPWCSAWLGYGSGRHAPGGADVGRAAAAHHHLLLAHGEAVRALRATVPGRPVGITLNPASVYPATEHPDDVAAARRLDGNLNRLFLEPLFHGKYPGDMLEVYAGERPGFSVVQDGDMEVIAEDIDFLGVNFYSPKRVVAEGREAQASAAGYCVPPREPDPVAEHLGIVGVVNPQRKRTVMGWEIEPDAFTRLLTRIHADYGPVPMYITENGAAFDDYTGPDGEIRDPRRVRYLDGHLRAVRRAMDAGANVRGYFVWSLMDNFEWSFGYSKRFGLVWIDYPTGRRVPKASFAWYRDVVAANALPAEPPELVD
jgi:beta-glucosidase